MTTLAPLTVPDLRRILTDVRGSLISQYTALFGYSGVEIRFTASALNEICKKASERGGGARGLRGIMVRAAIASWRVVLIRWSVGKSSVGTNVWSTVSVLHHPCESFLMLDCGFIALYQWFGKPPPSVDVITIPRWQWYIHTGNSTRPHQRRSSPRRTNTIVLVSWGRGAVLGSMGKTSCYWKEAA